MENNQQYYNARPSAVANIGNDVSGAKRHHFDTYETEQEKKERQAANRALKNLKAQIKTEILADEPDPIVVMRLLEREFELKFGFSPDPDVARDILKEMRVDATDRESINSFNSLVRAYNKLHKDIRGLDSPTYGHYKLSVLQRRYRPKNKPIGEQCGKAWDWKHFNDSEIKDLDKYVHFLTVHTSAVQFGNSVSDKERAYIIKELAEFLQAWNQDSIFKQISLRNVNWSFGARGKAGSVAYYEPKRDVISVNRNNIGSLIHEVGHFIDYKCGLISNDISNMTVIAYRDRIREGLTRNELNYFCSRKEIFARAFEAYCLKVKAGFSEFAQYAHSEYLPDLNDELLTLIGECFRIEGGSHA